MNQTDSLEALLAEAREEIGQLKNELRDSERQLARLLEMFEEQQRQVNSQQVTLVRIERILMDLVTGRLWRTLRAVGGVVKTVMPGNGSKNGAQGSTRRLIAKRNTHLICDEPNPDEARTRSGKITVRGWSAAKGGVDSIQVEVAGLPLIEAQPSIPRPDVQKALPHLDKTGRAGFSVQFDSRKLGKGRHEILLRALVKGKVVRETRTFVDIDHDKGFIPDYQQWIHEFERPESQIIDLKVTSFAVQPKISVIMPVYNAVPDELEAALESSAQSVLSPLGTVHL